MAWTGTELIIWGGQGPSGYLRDGARYDPKTKIWTKFPDPPPELDGRNFSAAVWSGKELIVWGGFGTLVSPSYARSDGARYLPGGSWTRFTVPKDDIFSVGSAASRQAPQAWFGAGKMWIWGGAAGSSSTPIYYSNTALAGAASYDPTTDKWTTIDTTGAPSQRARASVVWTGSEAIIWGGASSGGGTSATSYNNGVIYRP
jgi:N-acetylneuraminic acid mutarotase